MPQVRCYRSDGTGLQKAYADDHPLDVQRHSQQVRAKSVRKPSEPHRGTGVSKALQGSVQ